VEEGNMTVWYWWRSTGGHTTGPHEAFFSLATPSFCWTP